MFSQDTRGPQTNSRPLYSPTFVTELARPATMTNALPGLVAGTMLAARHPHTALTVQPLPAWVTPDEEKHRVRVWAGDVRKWRQDQSIWKTRRHDSPQGKQALHDRCGLYRVTYVELDNLTPAFKVLVLHLV